MLNTMKPLDAQSEKHQIPKEITIFLKQRKSMLQALKNVAKFLLLMEYVFHIFKEQKSEKLSFGKQILVCTISEFQKSPY